MPTKTKQPPPIVVEPDAERLMVAKMQDTLSGHADIGVGGDDFTTFF